VKASPPKIVETKDRVDFVLPTVAAGYRGRNCSAGVVVGAHGVSGGADCNAGVAMRVVSTRIVSEERL
jgi:hypothetical protein